jgi:hypothetical protein
MAFDTLILKNPLTGELAEAPVGFSWTTFFFGPLPALFRADWLHALIFFVISFFTFGLLNIVFAFIYNKLYIKKLIYKNGFKIVKCESGDLQTISNKLKIELPLLEE